MVLWWHTRTSTHPDTSTPLAQHLSIPKYCTMEGTRAGRTRCTSSHTPDHSRPAPPTFVNQTNLTLSTTSPVHDQRHEHQPPTGPESTTSWWVPSIGCTRRPQRREWQRGRRQGGGGRARCWSHRSTGCTGRHLQHGTARDATAINTAMQPQLAGTWHRQPTTCVPRLSALFVAAAGLAGRANTAPIATATIAATRQAVTAALLRLDIRLSFSA